MYLTSVEAVEDTACSLSLTRLNLQKGKTELYLLRPRENEQTQADKQGLRGLRIR